MKSKESTCPHCGEKVILLKKIFATMVCPKCNKIVSSKYGIEAGK